MAVGAYPEAGYANPSDTVALDHGNIDISRRNEDDLLIPSTKRFGVCVGIYKVILAVESVLLVLAVIMIASSVAIVDLLRESLKEATDPKTKDILEGAIEVITETRPNLIVSVLLGILQNVVGWAGMRTFRLRWIRFDLGIQLFFLIKWILNWFLLSEIVPGLFGLLIGQAIEVSILYIIMREITEANTGGQAVLLSG